MTRRALEVLFVFNASVLCVHQIDAAFWHEWELFHIPGGNPLNLILNLPIIASVFWAYRQVARDAPRWRLAHGYLAALGLVTVILHATFLALGSRQFMQPVSLALIGMAGVLSAAQLAGLAKAR